MIDSGNARAAGRGRAPPRVLESLDEARAESLLDGGEEEQRRRERDVDRL
jgi:hypothetical protein